ncbi:M20 family metallopeptidase [Tissierella sp. MSJ-40]|uniref:Probable succinyl-diaminopimelate desuccinylase n=1 Tax=Tissierella simiarum TaxID=2841534 RepID=A0ABS6E1X4_9FIRM|nr:M20 family metallopeptidase [Tissierella simiarum]MBU5436907.1 M20 family metallopeptidase [Tissierella simiarum]
MGNHIRNDFLNEDKATLILKKLVKTNSTNPLGNEMDMVKAILDYFPKDVDYHILDHGNNRGSLVINIPGKGKDSLAFIGHIDTVPVSDESSWDYPPFEGLIEEGYLYGRGSSDMKGGVTSMILTALYFIENHITPSVNLKFLFTADEESGGIGITSLREEGYLDGVSVIFIAEPSDEKIGLCEKGALWLQIFATGKESHGSKPELGVNAVENLIDFIYKLKKIVDLEKQHPLLGRATFAITQLKGGVKTNITPSKAEATLDIRTVPGMDHEDIMDKAFRIADEMEELNPQLKLNIVIENNRPAISTKKEEQFVKDIIKTYEELDYPVDFKGINFYTDASQVIPFYNVPFVILGPGEEKMAHQKNERIEIQSVVRMAKFYISHILNQ